MDISQIAKYIVESAAKADVRVTDSFEDFMAVFHADLKMLAPVDKGDFRESWESSIIGSSATFSNRQPYAAAIEFGSAPGYDPWPSPGQKTTVSGGRIYSTQAVGGTINKVFDEKAVNAFAEKLAKSIVGAFK